MHRRPYATEEGLLPGLPDDLAVQCMLRVPRIFHVNMHMVNSQWRRLVRSNTFYSERKKLGISDESILLLPQESKTPGVLECVEFDLTYKKKRKLCFKSNFAPRDIFLDGHGCASIGKSVLIFGGQEHGPKYKAHGDVNMFDTMTTKWAQGASMLTPRGGMAWGVLKNQLVVAGGYGGEGIGSRIEAEIYDIEKNEWWPIANLPCTLLIDLFFVLKEQLFVRGWVRGSHSLKLVSYNIESNAWKEEPDMLCYLQGSAPFCLNKVAIKSKDNSLYMLEVKDSNIEPQAETEPVLLNIMKLDFKDRRWKKICKILDEVMHYDCNCSFERDVRFHSMKNSVAVLDHSDEQENIEVKLVGHQDVLKISVLCPSHWTSAIIEV